jgi:2-keto-3-deoxygluconate permease
MKIKATIERIPGGMMLVPLLLRRSVKYVGSGYGAYFGSFTKGMISGTVPILAVWFFVLAASIDLRATGTVLRKSGTLVMTKIAVAWVVAMICGHLFLRMVFRPVSLPDYQFWLLSRRWI